jgi:hypothetical protein
MSGAVLGIPVKYISLEGKSSRAAPPVAHHSSPASPDCGRVTKVGLLAQRSDCRRRTRTIAELLKPFPCAGDRVRVISQGAKLCEGTYG